MDLSKVNSEPLVQLIEFHNQLNRNIKIAFGALSKLDGNVDGAEDVVRLPTGSEPWGRETQWRDLDERVKGSAGFIAELGLVRAASAFEDYVEGSHAELNRFGAKGSGSSLGGLITRLGVNPSTIADSMQMADFFKVARNCVVHRSNRANQPLATIAQSSAMTAVLQRWPKRQGKWPVSIPQVVTGAVIEWRPRHAIMASDAYYRLAVAIDRALVNRLGELGLVCMAAHWCLLANPPAPCTAKINPETMVRSQLLSRYRAREVDVPAVVRHVRRNGKWNDVRAAYARRFSDAGAGSPTRS